MTHHMDMKDVITEHVRNLLDMDEDGQRAQLASFSNYATKKNPSNGYSFNVGTSGGACGNRARPGVASSASVSTSGSSGRESSYSIDSPESSGSEGLAKCSVASAANGAALAFTANGVQVPGLTIPNSQEKPAFAKTSGAATNVSDLDNATNLLRAALANWESCLHSEETRAAAQQVEAAHQAQQALAAEEAEAMPAKIPVHSLKSVSEHMTVPPTPLHQPAAAPTLSHAFASQHSHALSALQRAMSHFSNNLSGEALQAQLLSQAAVLQQQQQHQQKQQLQQQRQQEQQQKQQQKQRQAMLCMDQDDLNLQAMKLVRQRLEQQQAESALNIRKMMMQDQPVHKQSGFDAMAPCFVPSAAGASGEAWPPVAVKASQPLAMAATLAGPAYQPTLNVRGAPLVGAMPDSSWVSQAVMSGATFATQHNNLQLKSADACSFSCPAGHCRLGLQPIFTPRILSRAVCCSGCGKSISGNPGQAGAHLRRPFASQAGRQRHGIGSVKAGPPGLHGNATRKNCAAPPPGIQEETLRAHLRELQKIDPDRVVLVRKINRLGFESPAMLAKHYSKFGKVERVLVAHSHVKSQNRCFSSRLRPSGLGFVVMNSKEEADAILALGPEQTIRFDPDPSSPGYSFPVHATIRVQRFQRHSEDAENDGLPAVDEEQEDQEDGDVAEVIT